MVQEAEILVPQISPTQVWALITVEHQRQVIRLLTQLAVQVIAAQVPDQRSACSAKERLYAYPSTSIQDPPRPS